MIARACAAANALRKKLLWMASAVLIFSLIYSSSYAALLWQPASPDVDTRSALTADYSPWSFLTFQPLDPAIIKEIQQEQKYPDQLVVPGSFWPPAEVPSPDQSPTAGGTPDPQSSETTMPAGGTDSPAAAVSPLPPTPVKTLPAPLVTAIPTQPIKKSEPTSPPNISVPTSPPKQSPSNPTSPPSVSLPGKSHPVHPDHPDHPNN